MTVQSENGPGACSNPIDTAVLADYWLGALPTVEEEPVEEHLLSCDSCGARLREMIAFSEGVRNLAREGSLRMVVSDAFLKRAAQEGLRIRQYAPPPGGSVQCTIKAEDNILIGRLAADLSGAKRIDLSICDERRTEMYRLQDIPVHPETGAVLYQESSRLMKAAPDVVIIARLVAHDEAGRERLLGEYTFDHKRSLPGPGGE